MYQSVTCNNINFNFRLMATGESYASLSFAYRISACHISKIVKEVLILLKKVLLPIFMSASSERDFQRIADEFWNKWNFPNCTGAIDGKHIRIKAPGNSGSPFFSTIKNSFQLCFQLLWMLIINLSPQMSVLMKKKETVEFSENLRWERKSQQKFFCRFDA